MESPDPKTVLEDDDVTIKWFHESFPDILKKKPNRLGKMYARQLLRCFNRGLISKEELLSYGVALPNNESLTLSAEVKQNHNWIEEKPAEETNQSSDQIFQGKEENVEGKENRMEIEGVGEYQEDLNLQEGNESETDNESANEGNKEDESAKMGLANDERGESDAEEKGEIQKKAARENKRTNKKKSRKRRSKKQDPPLPENFHAPPHIDTKFHLLDRVVLAKVTEYYPAIVICFSFCFFDSKLF